MTIELHSNAALRAAALRAYEVGRLRSALFRALALAGIVAAAGWMVFGLSAVPWSALTLLAWIGLGIRGRALLRGGRYGLVAGALTFLLPLSVLRPCCRPGSMMTTNAGCCISPSSCVLAGVALGLLLAWFVPRTPGTRAETAAGMMLGVASVAVLKCTALFLGETLGLLGGLVAGITAVSFASAWIDRRVPT